MEWGHFCSEVREIGCYAYMLEQDFLVLFGHKKDRETIKAKGQGNIFVSQMRYNVTQTFVLHCVYNVIHATRLPLPDAVSWHWLLPSLHHA